MLDICFLCSVEGRNCYAIPNKEDSISANTLATKILRFVSRFGSLILLRDYNPCLLAWPLMEERGLRVLTGDVKGICSQDDPFIESDFDKRA